MKAFFRFGLAGLLAILGATGLWLWASRPDDREGNSAIAAFLSDPQPAGYARALTPGGLEFPRDFGSHDDFQTEWWYTTGNLVSPDGRPFGFQFTLFRRALAPPEADQPAAAADSWRTNQVYFAHFTISDIANERFYFFEKFSRGAAGLAGAQGAPFHIWIEDWQVIEQPDGSRRLSARADGVALDLTLRQTRPPVLHGENGLSVKGEAPGNASYYYSLVQQQTEGRVTIGGEAVAVSGRSWTDHEYSTSALDPGAVGWDWFSLQFEGGGEALMLFQIRREDGTIQEVSAGSWILPDGSVLSLAREDWQIDVFETWTSPTTGFTYPAGWRLRIPRIGLDLTGTPRMNNQELNVSTTYWEGAVRFTGTLDGQPITAEGYIEMTGYD